MDAWAVSRPDGTDTVGVEVNSAAKLIGVRHSAMERFIEDGTVEIAFAPTKERLVLIDSLWAMLPETFK